MTSANLVFLSVAFNLIQMFVIITLLRKYEENKEKLDQIRKIVSLPPKKVKPPEPRSYWNLKRQ